MLSLEGVHAHYGTSHILQGIDLVAEPGQVTAIIGRNGVGKTTTLRTIMGLVRPSAGRVILDGADIAGWPAHRVARAGIAYVPEGRLIFPDLTVMENIRVAERKPPHQWPVSRLFQLFPPLAERASARGITLSGGEQQMLAIARALISDPAVVLLDEPTQGLAPLMVQQLSSAIRQLSEAGMAVVLVEQNVGLVEQLAHVMQVMVKGKIVHTVPPGRFHAEAAEIRSRYLTV
jgi:branched-chain amino acid transport system ATP-binding protein